MRCFTCGLVMVKGKECEHTEDCKHWRNLIAWGVASHSIVSNAWYKLCQTTQVSESI